MNSRKGVVFLSEVFLCPLLFFVYINDLPECVSTSFCSFYVDVGVLNITHSLSADHCRWLQIVVNSMFH